MIVRVVPNVTGLDKRFDYTVPDELQSQIDVGSMVRVELNGRRVGGWVVDVDPADGYRRGELTPISLVSGHGPSQDLVTLADWAALRWASRPRVFLHAASPDRVVRHTAASIRTGGQVEPSSPATRELLAVGGGVLQLAPTADPLPVINAAVGRGPTLVVVPAVASAALLAARLRRSGLTVAVQPGDWSAAAGGVDVVIGARSAAWAPCRDLAAIVVIDEHDEALQEQSSPTWHARDVLVERGQRGGVPVILVSPSPTLTALEWAKAVGGVRRPPIDRLRRGWPEVVAVDRSEVEPWKRSLLSSALIQELRDPDRVVMCIHNTKGRARLLACRHCRSLARCEHCDAAVELGGDELVCRRCGTVRPMVCQDCGHSAFANVRPGITHLVDEIAAAADRPAVLIEGDQTETPPIAGVYVGTEAALHRVGAADTVAFLDFDREVLAARYRAAEQAMGLVVRAARIVGPAAGGGKILIQTFDPGRAVIQAAVSADLSHWHDEELARRRLLQLPPFAAIAEVSGVGAAMFVGSLADEHLTIVSDPARDGEAFLVRAQDWLQLGSALRGGIRPSGSRLRIAIDPAR